MVETVIFPLNQSIEIRKYHLNSSWLVGFNSKSWKSNEKAIGLNKNFDSIIIGIFYSNR